MLLIISSTIIKITSLECPYILALVHHFYTVFIHQCFM